MTEHLFKATYRAMMSARPFKPFTVELNTGQRYAIDDPHATAIHGSAAFFFAPGGVPVFFDHDSVTQIIDAPAHSAPGKRRTK